MYRRLIVVGLHEMHENFMKTIMEVYHRVASSEPLQQQILLDCELEIMLNMIAVLKYKLVKFAVLHLLRDVPAIILTVSALALKHISHWR